MWGRNYNPGCEWGLKKEGLPFGVAYSPDYSRHPFGRSPRVILDIQQEARVEAQQLDAVGVPARGRGVEFRRIGYDFSRARESVNESLGKFPQQHYNSTLPFHT